MSRIWNNSISNIEQDSYQERNKHEVRHGMDSFPCFMKECHHQSYPLPQDEQNNQDDESDDAGEDSSGQPSIHLFFTVSCSDTSGDGLCDFLQ